MENNTNTENSIKLQDGRIVQAFPKADGVKNAEKPGFELDKTGMYLSLRKKPSKPQPKTEEETSLQDLFTQNAFLFLANRDRILSDSRMLLAPADVSNGLMYTGAFPKPTLGVYIEWWLHCPRSVEFDKEGTMSLLWKIGGSPLSGTNWCDKVYEDGKTQRISVNYFIKLWPRLHDITVNYYRPQQAYQAYTLQQVIDILKQETTAEYYDESLREFKHRAQKVLLADALNDWKTKFETTKKERDSYQKRFHAALINSRPKIVKSFYDRYMAKKKAAQKRIEELKEERRILSTMFDDNKLTQKQYQTKLKKKKDEEWNAEREVREFVDRGLGAVFPELAIKEFYSRYRELPYAEASILNEIIEWAEGKKYDF